MVLITSRCCWWRELYKICGNIHNSVTPQNILKFLERAIDNYLDHLQDFPIHVYQTMLFTPNSISGEGPFKLPRISKFKKDVADATWLIRKISGIDEVASASSFLFNAVGHSLDLSAQCRNVLADFPGKFPAVEPFIQEKSTYIIALIYSIVILINWESGIFHNFYYSLIYLFKLSYYIPFFGSNFYIAL